ncbi:hypothetical protein PCE1_003250 [Barthelona sp. PCE]
MPSDNTEQPEDTGPTRQDMIEGYLNYLNNPNVSKGDILKILGSILEKNPDVDLEQDKPMHYKRFRRGYLRMLQNTNQFKHERYHFRDVALKFSYFGPHFHSFSVQRVSPNTVEGVLLQALVHTCLIPSSDWEGLRWSRCGRTDKGVSGFGQVVSLRIRSRSKIEDPLCSVEEELNYCDILNKVLPDSLKVWAWSPVSIGFNARHSCIARVYRYFFSDPEDMEYDLCKMQEGAKFLVGEHDFRNFCSPNVLNTRHFIRALFKLDIKKLPSGDYEAIIIGRSFLYHQVRAMMSVLFLVGRGMERPSIVEDMLDLTKFPRKPQFVIAPGEPLVLWDCAFEEDMYDIDWRFPKNFSYREGFISEFRLRACVIDALYVPKYTDRLGIYRRRRRYVKLADREMEVDILTKHQNTPGSLLNLDLI